MGELIIKTHDFEASKNQLKVFSEQTPTDLELLKVDISGGFLGLGDHKVTGYELNSLTTQIQDYLIDSNTLHIKFIKEFGQVYNALEALDKDYIQAILIAIKAAEKANDKVKVAQKDITKTIELQKKTINVLKQFKEKIDSYKHLGDIDKLWSDSQKIQKDVATITNNIANVAATIKGNSQEISSINKDILDINASTKSQIQAIETLNKFKATLDGCEHLKDVDKLWSQSEKLSKEISGINKKLCSTSTSIESQEQSIDLLLQFKDRLDNYEHLEETDETWNKCKTFEMDIASSKEIINLHEEQIDDLINSLQDMQKQNDERIQTFSKKLMLAYALAGGSIGIAIIEFVLLMLRVL